jgi:hypothetical protein
MPLEYSDRDHPDWLCSAVRSRMHPATAKVSGGDRMRLDATALPGPGAGKLYEVWLTNAARTQMYPVGSLGAERKGAFTVPPELMNAYSAIEVSVPPRTSRPIPE